MLRDTGPTVSRSPKLTKKQSLLGLQTPLKEFVNLSWFSAIYGMIVGYRSTAIFCLSFPYIFSSEKRKVHGNNIHGCGLVNVNFRVITQLSHDFTFSFH